MKRFLLGFVWAAAIPLSSVSAMSSAALPACPAPGQAIYGDYRCSTPSSSRAPCSMFVVSSISGGKAYGSFYTNGYYRWVFVYSGSFSCR
jgi:hypothetical protein